MPTAGDIPDLTSTADDEPEDNSRAETESILAKVSSARGNTHQCACHLITVKSQNILSLITYSP